MVHWRIILNRCEVGNTPAALDKMPFDGFFERKASKVSADDDLLVTCGFQVVSSLSAGGGSWSPSSLAACGNHQPKRSSPIHDVTNILTQYT